MGDTIMLQVDSARSRQAESSIDDMIWIPSCAFRMGSDRHYSGSAPRIYAFSLVFSAPPRVTDLSNLASQANDYPPNHRQSSFSIDQLVEMEKSLNPAH
jgi:hypothetical protein